MNYLQIYTIQSQVHISIFLNKYTYKNNILYIVKLSIGFTSLFMNILLCLNLTRLVIELKLGLEFGMFSKQININKYFLKPKLKLFIKSLAHL